MRLSQAIASLCTKVALFAARWDGSLRDAASTKTQTTACPRPERARRRRRGERQPLTAPSVIPAMNCFAPSAKISSSGMTAISDDAISIP